MDERGRVYALRRTDKQSDGQSDRRTEGGQKAD